MAKVIGTVSGAVFEGTYEECMAWIEEVEAEEEEAYPSGEADLEMYTIISTEV